nr:hypothetical protein [uncultured Brevundimonas sp.]
MIVGLLALLGIVEIIKAAIIGIGASIVTAMAMTASNAPVDIIMVQAVWIAIGAGAVVTIVRIGGSIVEKAKADPLPWLTPLFALLSASAVTISKELIKIDHTATNVAIGVTAGVLTTVGAAMAGQTSRSLKFFGIAISFAPAMLFLSLATRGDRIPGLIQGVKAQPVLFLMCLLLLVGGGVVVALLANRQKT